MPTTSMGAAPSYPTMHQENIIPLQHILGLRIFNPPPNKLRSLYIRSYKPQYPQTLTLRVAVGPALIG